MKLINSYQEFEKFLRKLINFCRSLSKNKT